NGISQTRKKEETCGQAFRRGHETRAERTTEQTLPNQRSKNPHDEREFVIFQAENEVLSARMFRILAPTNTILVLDSCQFVRFVVSIFRLSIQYGVLST